MFKRGEAMPVAMVLGGDPLCVFYGGMEAVVGIEVVQLGIYIGGALGGVLRIALTRLPIASAPEWPWVTLAINLVGDGIRDALDPRQR